MNFDIVIQQIAEQLPVGSTHRQLCPSCQGGDHHEVTFVVGRESTRIWYKCFRASCAVSGVVGSANLPTAIQAELSRAVARLNPYTKPIRSLEVKDLEYFWDRFEITPLSRDIGVSDEDEYVVTVRGPHGNVRGHVQRQPVWKGMPKAPRQGRATYFDTTERDWKKMPKTVLFPRATEPQISWHLKPRSTLAARSRPPTENHIVLVEDQISALKVASRGVTCVALLGNGMNAEAVRELCKFKPEVVTIALDPGAEGQAQALARKWGLYFPKTRVVALEADPKDIPAKDLMRELL